MIAVELVELRSIVGSVFRPVPPAPVAALCDQQLFVREPPRILRDLGRFVVGAPCGKQQLPRAVVFFGPDPNVEICVDPGTWKNPLERPRLESVEGSEEHTSELQS